jgi:hypothetical protein
MKKLALLLIATIVSFSINLSANNSASATTEEMTCEWDSWFKYPTNNAQYEAGKSVYVRIDPKKYQHIAQMELYINGHFVRKESQYPYEWAKGQGSSDSYLRHMKPGTYKLKVRIKDKCGRYHEKYCTFYVKGHGGGHENPGACEWESWFKYPKNNGNYEAGKDVYVKVDPKKYQHIAQMELFVNGKFVRKESSYPFEWGRPNTSGDNYLRNMKPGTYKLTVKIKDKCGKYHEKHCIIHVKGNGGGHENPTACEWDSWFKYPQNNGNYEAGKDIYVKVDPKKYQHIAYMELYINGQFIRKESQYPYEWAKGGGNSDSYLRNMKPGTYKLTVKIKDKCGNDHQKHCIIHVKGNGGGHNNPGACEWDSWFKYPKNNGSYRYGADVYVRVDPKKYQHIAHMELYVNGKFVRKESQYPYEWAKGSGSSDSYLRNLKRGTYKLKVRIKDKCGQYHEKYSTFYVR